MERSLKVSIIMPTYNRAGLIKETIDSIIHQTHSDWELIIVDDGSTDNTEEIMARINDERIKFYKAGKTGIVGKLKNTGIEQAGGDLIAFADSDDLWDKTKLAKQIAALQQYPESGFSLTGAYNFKTRGEPLEYFYKQREGLRHDNIFNAFFKSEVAIIMPSLVFKKECLQRIPMFDESKSFSDVEFVLELAKNFKAVILYEPLVFRRIHDANDSDTNWIKRHYQGLAMIRSHKSDLPANILAESLYRSHIHFGEKCLHFKKRGKAINSFFNAWLQRPLTITPLKKMAKTVVYFLKGK